MLKTLLPDWCANLFRSTAPDNAATELARASRFSLWKPLIGKRALLQGRVYNHVTGGLMWGGTAEALVMEMNEETNSAKLEWRSRSESDPSTDVGVIQWINIDSLKFVAVLP